jgi:hypothetical protein
MPAIVDNDPFVSAGWIKKHLHINEGIMLRLVSIRRVSVFSPNGIPPRDMSPRYRLRDVISWLEENGREMDIPEFIDRRKASTKTKTPAIPVEPARRRTTVSTT